MPTPASPNIYGQLVEIFALAPTLGGLLGTLGIGSFIGQYLSGGQQRREVRSRVLAALERAEDARWATDDSTYSELREAIQQLEAAALVAGVGRNVVREYIFLAHVAWRLSMDDWEASDPNDETRGGIPFYFSNEVTGAAGDVALCVWHPWVGRIGRKKSAAKRKERIDALDERVTKKMELTKTQLNKRH